jgi:hypothetical protein
MNICLLTDEQKSDVFRQSRNYTVKDLGDLADVALATKGLVKVTQCFNMNAGRTPEDKDCMIGLLNIMEWLVEPMAAFFFETGTWGNTPEHMKEETK